MRVTSFTETAGIENSSSSQSSQVLIARDGDKRREEYAGAIGQIVYLEIPTGRFIVLPAKSIYSDLKPAAKGTDEDGDNRPDDPPTLSPDQLLNEPHTPATYEKIGTETLAGRTTTKFRVIGVGGSDSQNEALIWIDEALGMPIRSEATSNSNGRTSKVITELKDLKLEVDERLFSWPPDYKKVETRLILELIRKDGAQATSKRDEK